MCFFYSLPKKAKQVARRYGKQLTLFDDTAFDNKMVIKGYDHKNSNLIVTTEHDIQFAKWGLIPFWTPQDFAEVIIKKNRNVNARSEEIFTTKSFRFPIDKQRCLIPATGWFEYHYLEDGSKQIYYMSVKDEEIYSFAGIYDFWTDKKTKERSMRYAIITCGANNQMYFIHNGGENPHRMPVILKKEDEKVWLDPETPVKVLDALMQPFPDELMDAYVIKKSSEEFRKAGPFDYDLTDKL